MLISAPRVLTPARELAPGWVLVEADRVVDLGQGPPPRQPDVALTDGVVVPGYVDAHVHGGGGAAFGPDGPDAAATAVAAHLAHGTTTMMASLVTDSQQGLVSTVQMLADLADDGLIAGIHLEGPWLSPKHKGAHDPDLLSTPTPQTVEELINASAGHLRMVTIAPELPGGLDAIARLADAGVVAAIGHTDVKYEVAVEALAAGASAGTHLYNAMRPLHHRKPGPIAALLEHPDARIELVADGVHVHPAALRLAVDMKPDRFLLITDAMAAAAASDGDYMLGSLAVTVRDGVATLAGSDTIAGSTLTMAKAVRFAVHDVGLPLATVITAATSTPAAMLGLDQVGSLEPGRYADLLVLDDGLDVQRVMRRGQWIGGA